MIENLTAGGMHSRRQLHLALSEALAAQSADARPDSEPNGLRVISLVDVTMSAIVELSCRAAKENVDALVIAYRGDPAEAPAALVLLRLSGPVTDVYAVEPCRAYPGAPMLLVRIDQSQAFGTDSDGRIIGRTLPASRRIQTGIEEAWEEIRHRMANVECAEDEWTHDFVGQAWAGRELAD